MICKATNLKAIAGLLDKGDCLIASHSIPHWTNSQTH